MHAADPNKYQRLHLNNPPASGYRIGSDTLTHKVLFAWWYMRKSTRRLIVEKPSEAYLLSLLLASDLAFFFAYTMKLLVLPNAIPLETLPMTLGSLFGIAIILRTAVMYIFAMVVGAICRLSGGLGTWRNTRIAIFWAAFVTAPFGILAALVSVSVGLLADHYPIFNLNWISLTPYWLGLLPFVWYMSAGVAKAHRFKRTSPLFLVMSIVSLVALIGAMYFRATGVI